MLAGCQGPQPANQTPQTTSPPITPIFGGPKPAAAQPDKPKPLEAEKIEARDDIIAINVIWQQHPWIGDQRGMINGFKAGPVYFQSGGTSKGAFVSGKIRCDLFRIDRKPGRIDRFALQSWEFDAAKARGFRLTRRLIGGYGYGFLLNWANDLNLAGREIEVEFSYERADGRVVSSPPERLKVPLNNEDQVHDVRDSQVPQ